MGAKEEEPQERHAVRVTTARRSIVLVSVASLHESNLFVEEDSNLVLPKACASRSPDTVRFALTFQEWADRSAFSTPWVRQSAFTISRTRSSKRVLQFHPIFFLAFAASPQRASNSEGR